jgi:Cdc6-like AAA superfamily ATPase
MEEVLMISEKRLIKQRDQFMRIGKSFNSELPNFTIQNDHMENMIRNSILNHFGTNVLLGSFRYGKTTLVKKVCKNMLDNDRVSGVIYKQGKDVSIDKLTWSHKRFYDSIGIESVEPISNLISDYENPFILILDHFDNFLMDDHSFIKYLIEMSKESEMSKKFIILLITENKNIIKELEKLSNINLIHEMSYLDHFIMGYKASNDHFLLSDYEYNPNLVQRKE